MSTKQILHLQRIFREQGSKGILTFEGEVICRTIELPWRNNLERLSCIPVGSYKLEKRKYTGHGEQIGIPAVLGREKGEEEPKPPKQILPNQEKEVRDERQ
ncbi:DUF5675 family protein [Sphingobacterium sp. UDSM-2020]|uniref:DUF5675 family protein n=2 Tax=Sphingobacteriaceae TaxID=84566 RepID=UPI00193641FD|nr:DUF5675 family protein [Sphingobacterium sp. UDSM-2020]QQD12382.1 hypothetical protein JAZ75_17455 [Sphingobacterium sp. UDSM-2020]